MSGGITDTEGMRQTWGSVLAGLLTIIVQGSDLGTGMPRKAEFLALHLHNV